jgi:hypothetical protein
MKPSFIISLLMLLSVSVLNAGEPKSPAHRILKGKVTDAITGEELSGVLIKSGNQQIHTDINGSFQFEVSGENPEIFVSGIAYEEKKVKIDPYQYTELEITLQELK